MDLNPGVALIILFQLAALTFYDVIQILNLPVFNIGRTPASHFSNASIRS